MEGPLPGSEVYLQVYFPGALFAVKKIKQTLTIYFSES